MLFLRNASIGRKLTLAFIGMGTAAVILASIVFLTYDWITIRQSMANDLTGLSQVIGTNSTAALTFNDPATAGEVLSALSARPHIHIACVYELTEPLAFAFYSQPGQSLNCPVQPDSDEVTFTSRYMSISTAILLDGQKIGAVYMRQGLDEMWNAVSVHLKVIGLVVTATLVLSLLAATLIQRFITLPILRLASTAQDIAESKNYALRAPASGNDEVGQLVQHFNSMLCEIEARDDEVRLAREQLQHQVEQTTAAYNEQQKTMQRLKETQRQLVQTEKMASLGGLVAGVAHEINTPVGVGVTAASTLKARTKDFRESYENDSLTPSALRAYTELATQAADILLTNLDRAAQLIHSFKQVAVDQTSSDRREFELASYIDEILLSLRPHLKQSKHHIDIKCPSGIMVNSYPGALSQVLTNFIMNSLIHGFENEDQGTICIEARLEGDNIFLRYADNGKGISQEHQPQIFDPFFTTKRGMGGSGLGLHIVYNLVTHTLNGSIKLHSAPGEGTAYEILFPLQEKQHHEQANNA